MSGVAGGYTRTNARLRTGMNRPDRASGKRAMMEKGPDGKFLGVDEARGIARAECAPRCANGFRTRSSIVSIDTASDRDSIGP